ncbi:MAG TPA: hypothetical protein VID76_01155 [Solirubrobacterales bacterium]|jgi:hypothetical protein
MTTQETQINATMTIRRMDLDDGDARALARLAALDSRAQLEGPVLGAEVEGRLLAAIAVASGDVVADPFSRTSELRALLKLRRAQIQERSAGTRRRRSRIFGRSSRPAVGGSPAGQIITLPRVN